MRESVRVRMPVCVCVLFVRDKCVTRNDVGDADTLGVDHQHLRVIKVNVRVRVMGDGHGLGSWLWSRGTLRINIQHLSEVMS